MEIEFNYELLDDSYTIFNKSGGKSSSFFLDNVLSPDATEYPSYDWHSMYLYDDTNEGLVPEAQPYHESSSLMKYNHPLMIMVKEERVVSELCIRYNDTLQSSQFKLAIRTEFDFLAKLG